MATKAQRLKANENRLKAMSHPLRREILRHLIEGGVTSPVEAANTLDVGTADVSYHMKRLVALGCAELVSEEKVRGAVKHSYRATERHLIDTDEWEDLDPVIREGLLVDFMQPSVDDFTASAKSGILGASKSFHITRTPLAGIDRQGLDELLKVHKECFDRCLEVQARAAVRLAKSNEESICVSSSQGCFQVPSF